MKTDWWLPEVIKWGEREVTVAINGKHQRLFELRRNMNSTGQRIQLILNASALTFQDFNPPRLLHHPYLHPTATTSSYVLLL